MKEKDECNVTTLKQVYNARYRYKRSIRGSRTELQQLMLMLERDHYIHFSRCLDESDVFNECVHRLELVCQPWPVFFEYVNDSWIIPYKKFFVKAWTNKVMHLGNTTSNKVESAHWSLKKVLGSSMGDLCSCWDGIHNVIILQHNEIKASFERSLNLISDSYKALSYRRLVGNISRCALELLAPELERVKKIGFDSSRCGCILRQTYGLPCACELARYDPGIIPLQEIHVMWTRLSFSNVSSSQSEGQLSIQREVDLLLNLFKEVDIAGKVTIKHKLLDIVCPSMTSMLPPPSKVKTKGAAKSHRSNKSTKRDPSYFEHVDAFIESSRQDTCVAKIENKLKSKRVIEEKVIPMLEQFNPVFHPYILDVVDVVADDHCGYRCIAALLVGGYDRLEELRKSLLVHSPSGANRDKWMTIPDMGYAIANRYNVILVCLSSVQNLTIFPLRTSPPISQSQHRLICIEHVYSSHFVQVRLQEGCPLPTVDIILSSNCYPKAKGWASFYRDRMQAFLDLHVVDRSYVDLMED
ncbi:uncharacterized protein LOC114194217 [Vigna unguiculata]|uniref:uncharacterized protein LOC114194217 n=1 Tax=Vigna unguiculata TaxID=3917 RepID=UPI00101643A3|nr:uncharacterized protein LOC114194217 [Vigna unguiculata]